VWHAAQQFRRQSSRWKASIINFLLPEGIAGVIPMIFFFLARSKWLSQNILIFWESFLLILGEFHQIWHQFSGSMVFHLVFFGLFQ
jgi:hypothetical protein